MDVLFDYPLSVIFLVSGAAFLIASEIGHRLGLRRTGEANVSTLEASVLGLLALMLSFTFAMALTRFDARRDALLSEANAIGTAALRAGLLPAPHAAESVKLFRDYVQVRLDVTKRVPTPAEFDAAIARSNAIQTALWRQAKAAMAKDNAMAPNRPLYTSPERNVRQSGEETDCFSYSRAEYRSCGSLWDFDRGYRLRGIRERARETELEVAGLCYGALGCRGHTVDSGH